jgi:hypothetical protein
MRVLKIVAIVAVAYVGVVVVFESLLGVLQPTPDATVLIRTFDEDGTAHERVVSRIESEGKLYVAANHWPRAWYRRALRSPDVQVVSEGRTRDYRAVPVRGAEYERVDGENGLPPFFRVLTGFPPRRLLRLEPR